MRRLNLFLLLILTTTLVRAEDIALQPVFGKTTFKQPVLMLQAPGEGQYWYVVERHGRIHRLKEDGSERQLSVDLGKRVDAGPMEAGLLGMAFHPQFAENNQVFLSYTRDGSPLVSVLARYSMRQGKIDLDSETILLEIAQPYSNHNGGHIAFGPDGYLYYGLGDGGAAGDPEDRAQNTDTLLGKMLRIDVDTGKPYAIPADNPFSKGGGRAEIFARGLRNPWRWSFDRVTGALWVGDVGQNRWEEIDQVTLGDNLGWNRWEGLHCYNQRHCGAKGMVMPRVEYGHDQGCSVTGGYVYRGKALPKLVGYYFYSDFCSGTLWALAIADKDSKPQVLLQTGKSVASFAESLQGELYLLDFASGRIFQVIED